MLIDLKINNKKANYFIVKTINCLAERYIRLSRRHLL